uniref:RRM domain-containing protein n=1 Tax=Bionectria ochroleuca TaxID=29856 RepID=A0A8H7N6V4_BIOOC
MASTLPVSTVYVQNLEERVKPDALTYALRAIFEEFGNVVDIVAKKNLKAKGQAFVVFDDLQSAQTAIEEVQGFPLFDKPLRVAMARSKSDKTVELNCSGEELESHKRHRQAEKEKRQAEEAAEEQKQLKRAAGAPTDPRPIKAARPSGLKSTSVATSSVVPDEYLPPNKILFLQNLPDASDVDALTAIFSRFEGFREVRTVPGRRNIAFVEYEAEQGAISAKESTAGMTLGDKNIRVTYQRQ